MEDGSVNSLTTLPELSGEQMSQEIALAFLQGLAGAIRLSLKSQQPSAGCVVGPAPVCTWSPGEYRGAPIHLYTGALQRQHPYGSIPMG